MSKIIREFKSCVKDFPTKAALISNDQCISYAEMDYASDALLNKLIQVGVRPGQLVGVLVDQNQNWIVSLLSLIKLGACYVPLDSQHPEKRLQSIVTDANLTTIITSNACRALVEDVNEDESITQIINIDELESNDQIIEKEHSLDSQQVFEGYIIYTSGSTGRPKGVVHTYDNLINMVEPFIDKYDVSNRDTILILTPYTHTVAIIDAITALVTGATIYLAETDKLSTLPIAEIIEKNKITIFHSVPTVYRYFLSQDTQSDFSSIRLVILGGEKVLKSDFDQFKSRFSHNALFVNLFGSSESIIVASYSLTTADTIETHVMPIGNLFEEHLSVDLPHKGEVQELVISGEYLTRGYLNRPEETKRKIHSGNDHKDSIFYTGDHVAFTKEGVIHYDGREDDQVKIDGNRVELGEVESLIMENNNELVHCKIIYYKEGLYVFLEPVSGTTISTEQIKDQLSLRLPSRIVPREYIVRNELPVTTSGKIDTIRLKEFLQQEMKKNAMAFDEDKNEVSSFLETIWKEVLEIEHVDFNKHIQDQGGNSLKLSRIHLKINEKYPDTVTMQDLFDHGSLNSISKILQTLLDGDQEKISSEEAYDIEF